MGLDWLQTGLGNQGRYNFFLLKAKHSPLSPPPSLSFSLSLMLKPFTSHHMPLAIRVGSGPTYRSLLLLKAWSQQTRWNRGSHELARRDFFSRLTSSKPTVSCSATGSGSAENVKKTRLSG